MSGFYINDSDESLFDESGVTQQTDSTAGSCATQKPTAPKQLDLLADLTILCQYVVDKSPLTHYFEGVRGRLRKYLRLCAHCSHWKPLQQPSEVKLTVNSVEEVSWVSQGYYGFLEVTAEVPGGASTALAHIHDAMLKGSTLPSKPMDLNDGLKVRCASCTHRTLCLKFSSASA